MDLHSKILVSRLLEFYEDDFDPWYCGLTLDLIHKTKSRISTPYTPYESWTASQHAARIRFLMENPDQLNVPIGIDNYCSDFAIYPEPIITDGNHRFLAHVALKKETILASYGGRVDLLDYLSGKTDEVPE